jgi:divalent metal cation (Fe/Co/Zn/Cd) transporter
MAADHKADRTYLLKRSAGLEYFTVGWDVVAAAVASIAGVTAGSIALISFGLDHIITFVSAGMLLVRIRMEVRGEVSTATQRAYKRRVQFGIGVTFFLLALYILNEAGSRLFYGEKPEKSNIGLALSVSAVIVTVILAVLKLLTAKALGSRTLSTDARETAVRCYLPLMLFFGLWLHASYAWWWADPAAALFMLPLIVRGGWKAIEESKDISHEREARKTTL